MESTKKMKIIHTTHDTAPGRSTQRPSSATQRLKDYFSTRIHGPLNSQEEDEEALIQQEPTVRQRRASETQVSGGLGICAVLMKEHKELKRRQREKRMYEASEQRMTRANEKASAQVLKERSGPKIAKSGRAGYGQLQEVSSSSGNKSFPTLRRVKSIGSLNEVKTKAEVKPKASGGKSLTRMHSQRQAIREGNLEKVITRPPSSGKPELTPEFQDASQKKTRHRRSTSTSSKLTSYLETSADLLDATRRDLTSNLRKSAEKAEKVLSSKFDQFGRYSSGHGNDWDDSSDSDESFYCIGERRLSELDKARRISGDGTNPWIDGPQGECRLCRKASPAGVRGLCRQCENEFRRPKTTVLVVDDEDEVKPPPPLKIKKAKAPPKNAEITAVDIHNPFSDETVLTSKTNRVDKKPRIITSGNHISQQVYIDDGCRTPQSGTEYLSRYERWQSTDLRAQYQSQEKENSRWSPRLLDHDQRITPQPSLRSSFNKTQVSPAINEDTGPLTVHDAGQSNQKQKSESSKNQSYYGYWDDIPSEDQARIASLANPGDRSSKPR